MFNTNSRVIGTGLPSPTLTGNEPYFFFCNLRSVVFDLERGLTSDHDPCQGIRSDSSFSKLTFFFFQEKRSPARSAFPFFW